MAVAMDPGAPIREKSRQKRTRLFAATVLFMVSAVAQVALAQGESTTDVTQVCAGSMHQDTPPCALAADGIDVEQNGDEFLVCARSEVDADRATIWSTISDYDHLAAFIPGMFSSRTVSRTGARAVVEQKGDVGVGPFHRRFSVLLAVSEMLDQSISTSRIGGDFRCFESRYEIVSLRPQRARIVYQATLVPETPFPAVVGLFAMRSVVGTQFDALLEEIRRREERVNTAVRTP